MTKILYLIDGLGIGGAERQLCLLLKYLPTSWHSRVVSLSGGAYYQTLIEQGTLVEVYQRRSRFDLSIVTKLYQEILRYQPAIIHTWGGLCSALAAPLCKILRIRMIDGSIRIAGTNRHRLRRKITFALADHIVANSFAGLAAFQAPAKKSSVIYNAMDPERLKLLAHKELSPNESTTVVMAARISPFKDFTTFFEAARLLHVHKPGCWKFVAIGAGDDKDRLIFQKQAADLLASGAVELPEAGLEVLPYLEKANIGVLLSAACFKEGLSNTIMEYMFCGLPVVCTNSGGNKELVLDGKTGFIIQPENIDEFITKLNYLKDYPEIACRMGDAGYTRVNNMCAIDRMTHQYETLYNHLLSDRLQ
jgi:glycosyltransferase involved in cell wall biosynthesis